MAGKWRHYWKSAARAFFFAFLGHLHRRLLLLVLCYVGKCQSTCFLENLLNIIPLQSTRIEEIPAFSLGITFNFVIRNQFGLFPQVIFISDQYDARLSVTIGLNLTSPIPHSLKGLGPGNIEHHQNNITVFIVQCKQGPILLLPRSIPNIHWYFFPVFGAAYVALEAGAHCTDNFLGEFARHQGLEDGGLAHTWDRGG